MQAGHDQEEVSDCIILLNNLYSPGNWSRQSPQTHFSQMPHSMAEDPSSNSIEQIAHLSWPLIGFMCFHLALLDLIYSTKSGNDPGYVLGYCLVLDY